MRESHSGRESMATWRARHAWGHSEIPFDRNMLAAMAFFIALAFFVAALSIWGFGLSSGLRFL